MPAGTIALTNNSATVTGSGTSFTSDLKPNDFIVAIVGGITYTLGVQSVASATGLTLITPYNGPTTSGVAWTAVPNAALVGITAQVAADVARAIRGLNLDKANWQQVFSGTGAITVTLPDGSTYSGPAWSAITNSINARVEKNQNLNDLPDKSAARLNLGLKGSAILDVGSAPGTVAAGNDGRIVGAIQRSGGVMLGPLYSDTTDYSWVSNPTGAQITTTTATNLFAKIYGRSTNNYAQLDFYEAIGSYYAARIVVANNASAGNFYNFEFRGNGQGFSSTGWTTYSDKRLKTDVKVINNPIDRLKKMRGYTYTKLGVKGTGVIAQEAQEALPEAVTDSGSFATSEGETFENVLTLSPGDLVGLLIEVCRNQEERIQQRDDAIAELQIRMKAIDGLDA